MKSTHHNPGYQNDSISKRVKVLWFKKERNKNHQKSVFNQRTVIRIALDMLKIILPMTPIFNSAQVTV